MGGRVAMIFTDVNLAGKIDGVELANFTTQCYPNIHVSVTSGLALTGQKGRHAEAMAANGRAPRSRAFDGLTLRSRGASGRCVRPE
jgi:hypothetical protein